MDRSFQFYFMSVYSTQSSTLFTPILLPEFQSLSQQRQQYQWKKNKCYFFSRCESIVSPFRSLSFSLCDCVILACLNFIWHFIHFVIIIMMFFFVFVGVVIGIHHNPYCAYGVHPNKFHFSVIFQFVCLFIIWKFWFSLSLSLTFHINTKESTKTTETAKIVCVILLAPEWFFQASIKRVNWFVSLWDFQQCLWICRIFSASFSLFV